MGVRAQIAREHAGAVPYPIQFATTAHAEAMKAHAMAPHQGRSSPEKCEGASSWLQKGSRCSVVYNGEDPKVLGRNQHEVTFDDKLTCTVLSEIKKEEIDFFKTPKGVVHLNRKGIALAVEKRVALFFQQAILCHGMSNFVFSCRNANDQIGKASSLTLYGEDGSQVTFKREAAHSSTIPSLIAHAKDGSTPDGIVYLKGGTAYSQHQATIAMHEGVNGADELIDGKGADGRLRQVAVGLLNQVADGLSPMRATEIFLRAFKESCQKEASNLPRIDVRKKVLERYIRKIEKIETSSMTNPAFYNQLLGVVINPNDPREIRLREVIYQKRFDIIRLQEVVESRIGKRIEDLKREVGKRNGYLIEHILLKTFAQDEQLTVIERLFGKTAVFVEKNTRNEEKRLRNFQTKVQNLQTKFHREISVLQRDLRNDFRELSSAEFTYRSGVFKSLRTQVNNWYQHEFCDAHLKTTGKSVSVPWVSRMEQLSRLPTKAVYATPVAQRRRYITIEDGIDCARTFGVDAGVFFAGLFTSK